MQVLQEIEFDLTQPHKVTGTLFHDFRSSCQPRGEKSVLCWLKNMLYNYEITDMPFKMQWRKINYVRHCTARIVGKPQK